MAEEEVIRYHLYYATELGGGFCKDCGKSILAEAHDRTHMIGHDGGRMLVADFLKPGSVIPLSPGEKAFQDVHYDPVQAPAHYLQHKITAAEVIADWDLDFFLGSVIKYISRYKYKGTALQDIQKAAKYLSMEVELIEKGELVDSITHGGLK